MAPTKPNDSNKPAARGGGGPTRIRFVNVSRGGGGARRPAPVAFVVPLAPAQIRKDLMRRYLRARRREHMRALILELANLVPSTEPPLRRVPRPVEDDLAAMMAQMTTAAAAASAGGDRAAAVPAPAVDDQSSGLGEMFEKMAVCSEE